MDNDLISLGEAATFVGKNLRTIQRLIKAGKLTRHEKDGKNFISRKELERKFSIKAKNETPPSPIQEPTMPKPTKAYQPVSEISWQEEAKEYQKKWIGEV